MTKSTTSVTRFLSPKEFIKVTKLPRNTVYEGIRDRSIPSIRISKRKILIPEDALDRVLDDQQTKAG